MSIELSVATRHRRDMTEKMLKAMLNANKQQQQLKGCAHYTSHFSLYKPDAQVLPSSVLRDLEIVGLSPC